jgi:hypothetical protein
MPVAQKSCRWEHGVLTSRTCEASRTLIRIEIEATEDWCVGRRVSKVNCGTLF